jgi:hypothetical protein
VSGPFTASSTWEIAVQSTAKSAEIIAAAVATTMTFAAITRNRRGSQ